MSRNLIADGVQSIAVLVCLGGLLFASKLARVPFGGVAAIVREIGAVCRDCTCQWMLVICILGYLGVFLFLDFTQYKVMPLRSLPLMGCKKPVSFAVRSSRFTSFLLIILIVLCLVGYAVNYPASAVSLQLLTLLTGMVIGKGFAVWANFSSSGTDGTTSRAIHRLVAVFTIITGLLSFAAFYQTDSGTTYAYHGIRRWTGAWNNPNVFGLLMGVGIVLVIGWAISLLDSKVGIGNRKMIEGGVIQIKIKQKCYLLRHFCFVCCCFSVVLLGIGLYHSFSRGAWLATAVGVACLIAKSEILCHFPWLSQNKLSLSIIVLSAFLVVFWQLRFFKLQAAQRIASVVNPNDFSWRNRVDAWEGSARMLIDRPITGFGWGKAESVYATRYCTTASHEAAAIQMNDYLILGISGGVPVMFCFIGYVTFALSGREIRPMMQMLVTTGSPDSISASSNCVLPCFVPLLRACRAGVIVLLVGFWFDGGLFKLPISVIFWSLLELSRLEFAVPQSTSIPIGSAQPSLPIISVKPHRWLLRAAWLAMIAAAGSSAFYLFAPYLPVNNRTIVMARHYLILPRERADFDFLAAEPIWHGQKLKALLDQAELANYNRKLINWKLDEKIYQNYVLSPVIKPHSTHYFNSSHYNWRRALWEAFYPLIRHESSPADAVKIVVQHLREQVSIADQPDLAHSVSQIWLRKSTDIKGFQIIYVAVLRSVGVPGRLNGKGLAEFYDGTQWRLAPLPSVFSQLKSTNN